MTWLTATRAESHDGRSPAAGFTGCIAEVDDEGRAGENRAYELPAGSDTTAVNDAERRKTGLAGLDQVLLYHGFHIAGSYAVQIEFAGDGDADGLGFHVKEKKKPGAISGPGSFR